MEEADRLCDDIVVIDRGKKIAHGTADELKLQIGGERVELIVSDAADTATARAVLEDLSVGDIVADAQTRKLTAAVTGGADILGQVLKRLAEQNVSVADIGLRRPTLDDVFLSLTGHATEEAEAAAASEEVDVREKEVAR
jgi:ABC-2 type transport system ATP-binding protein